MLYEKVSKQLTNKSGLSEDQPYPSDLSSSIVRETETMLNVENYFTPCDLTLTSPSNSLYHKAISNADQPFGEVESPNFG